MVRRDNEYSRINTRDTGWEGTDNWDMEQKVVISVGISFFFSTGLHGYEAYRYCGVAYL